MQVSRNITKRLLMSNVFFKSIPIAGLKSFAPSPTFEDVEFPNRNKLKVPSKVPQNLPRMRPYKMQKRLRLMRGPELYHNTLLHKQYGIIATAGGRMKHCHFDMIRLTLSRKIDFTNAYAIWRIQEPWQPMTKRNPGIRLGYGKGNVDHYVTPLKSGQVIIELGGLFEFFEVKRVLNDIAKKLPFAAIAVDQKLLEERAQREKFLEEQNQNPWTWKYIIQNNMLGCHKWISKYDKLWFNKYL